MRARGFRSALLGCLLAGAGVHQAAWRPMLTGDEAWFLQVLDRVRSGEVLYRDVFFGATPLSVYLTAPLAAAWGAEVLVLRASLVVCFLLTVLLSCRIARRLGSPEPVRIFLALGLLALAFRLPTSLYSPIATLFFLGCLWATLKWAEEEGGPSGPEGHSPLTASTLAGVLAGLAFCSKQNIGVLALAALVLALFAFGRDTALRGSGRRVAVAVAAFVVTSVTLLVPVWTSRGLPKLLDYGFLNKTTYVRLASVSYVEGLGQLGRFLRAPRVSPEAVERLKLLVPPLALWAALGAWRRSGSAGRRAGGILFLFTGAACLGLFPRADAVHVTYVMPVFLLALAYSWSQLRPLLGPVAARLVSVGAGVFLGASLAVVLVLPTRAEHALEVSTLPHFRGLLTTRAAHEALRARAEYLSRATGGRETFIVSAHAAFYYLVAGIRNPTPFDYPGVTAFGRNGEAEVIAAISEGRILSVCLDAPLLDAQLPKRVVRHVQESMEPVRDDGFCTLYRVRPPGS